MPYKELRGNGVCESSEEIRQRVERARTVQLARGYLNAEMPSSLIRKRCALDDAGERTLEMAVRKMGLSARAHDRILKVARTIVRSSHRMRSRTPEGTDPLGYRQQSDSRRKLQMPMGSDFALRSTFGSVDSGCG